MPPRKSPDEIYRLNLERGVRVDPEDRDLLEKYTWRLGKSKQYEYLVAGTTPSFLLKRLVAERMGHKLERSVFVLQIDGDPYNCCRQNLKVAPKDSFRPHSTFLSNKSYIRNLERGVEVDLEDEDLLRAHLWRRSDGLVATTSGSTVYLRKLIAKRMGYEFEGRTHVVFNKDGNIYNCRRENIGVLPRVEYFATVDTQVRRN